MKVKVPNISFSKNNYLTGILIKEFPDSEFNTSGARFQGEELVEYLSGADAAIVGLEGITAKVLEQLPSLKIIAKYGVGLDNIDLNACKERNVAVGWTGGVNRRSVAEMSVGFMLALSRNLYITSQRLKQLSWDKNGGSQLTGKTVGIIGLGHIGKEVVELLKPFNCTILVNDIADVSKFAAGNCLNIVSKEEMYKEADIISIHTPYSADMANLFNSEVFSKMKPSSFLINTARGGIVNEVDLKYALQNNLIGGAALDVYETEPPVDPELLSFPNLICTPHTGGNSYEAVVAMGLSAISHLVNFKQENIK